MKKPLWLKYRNEMIDLREQVQKKEYEILLVFFESSRPEKEAELATLEKAFRLAQAKYNLERYLGLMTYASGLLDNVDVRQSGAIARLCVRALIMLTVCMKVDPRLKALRAEIKKLGGKAKAKVHRRNKEVKDGKAK